MIFINAKQSEFTERLVHQLPDFNPWWEDKPMKLLPTTRRHLVEQIKKRLRLNLAPITVVRGTRQIGKTTAYLHVISDLLKEGVNPKTIFCVQIDDVPVSRKQNHYSIIGSIIHWYESEILKKTLNQSAHAGEIVYLFLDEVQNIPDWASQLKSLVDANTIKVVVTGSSALRIAEGKDSLAGRIHTIEAGVLSLTEIGILRQMDTPRPFLPDNGIQALGKIEFWQELKDYGNKHQVFRDVAFRLFAERGSYPIAHVNADVDFSDLSGQLNENVIQKVIRHDLRSGERGKKRDESLLESIFKISCRYAGQVRPAIKTIQEELKQELDTDVHPNTLRAYFQFLEDTLLIRMIQPLEMRLKKKGKHQPKICLSDHILRQTWLQERVSLLAEGSETETLAGFLAESVSGTLLKRIEGLDVAYVPERSKEQSEVDFIISVGDQRIPIEIKYRNRIRHEHFNGLRSFCSIPLNRSPFGVLVSKNDEAFTNDENIVVLPLSTLLLLK